VSVRKSNVAALYVDFSPSCSEASEFTCAKYGAFRGYCDYCSDAGVGFSQSLNLAFHGFCFLHSLFRLSVAVVVIATLCICFPASYHIFSRGPFTLNLASFAVVMIVVPTHGVGDADVLPCSMLRFFFAWLEILKHRTLHVGFPASCRIAHLGWGTLNVVSNADVR
jgi:hypothetical protein